MTEANKQTILHLIPKWQSFRTKKNPALEFQNVAHEYAKPGTYKIMVKVVDILGIDTSKLVEVRVG